LKPLIKTYTGRMFPLDSPEPDDIDILDIAQGLSQTCRFSGQSLHFYSVAEHCVLISRKVPKEYALHALLHDAAEAYIGDMTAPLKYLLSSAGENMYRDTENRIMEAISSKYGFPSKKPDVIHEADLRMFATEATHIMRDGLLYPGIDPKYLPKPYDTLIINGWTPEFARMQFLTRFHELMSTNGDAA
jgi:uncharacterized protein